MGAVSYTSHWEVSIPHVFNAVRYAVNAKPVMTPYLFDTLGIWKYSDILSRHYMVRKSQILTSIKTNRGTAKRRWDPHSNAILLLLQQVLPTTGLRTCSCTIRVCKQTCPCSYPYDESMCNMNANCLAMRSRNKRDKVDTHILMLTVWETRLGGVDNMVNSGN